MTEFRRQLLLEICIVLGVIFLAAMLSIPAKGQIPGSPIAGALPFQFWDNSGVIMAGGKICTYEAGSSRPLSTYTTSALTTPNANPILLNGAGRAPVGIYIGAVQAYKFVALLGGDSSCNTGAVIWTQDNISGAGGISSIVGTPNQITVSTLGAVVTLSIPSQLITGQFSATNTGSNLVFHSPNIDMDGAGNITNTGVVLTHGGFNSEVGSWQGINTLTDGALLRGVNIAQNNAGTRGGYLVFAPVLYNPYDSPTVCHDIYGNIVTQPLPLPGLSNFGTNDLVMWNSTSPLMPADNSCGVPLPVNTDYGINTNGYFYARAGLATDIVAYNSIDSLRGGIHVALGATIDQASYYQNKSTCPSLNTPAAGYGGFGHLAGSVYCYYNDSTTTWNTVDLSMSGGGSVCGADTQIQFNDMASCGASANLTFDKVAQLLTVTGTGVGVEALGVVTGYIDSAGGFRTGSASGNAIQAPSGGMFAKAYTWAEEAAPSASNAGQATVYADSTSHMLHWSQNTGAFQKVATFKGSITNGDCAQLDVTATIISVSDAGGPCTTGGGGGTVTGSAQFNVGYYTAAGTATTIGGSTNFTFNSGTNTLTVTGAGVVTNGAFNSTITGSSTAFQANSGAFLVTGAGAVSAAGVISSTGASGGVNVTATLAANSIQTIGGIEACNAGTCTGGVAFRINGTAVMTSARAATLTGLTLSSITGSTQCLQVNTSGVVSGSGATCGGGGGSGVTSLNSLTGALSLNGTPNQVSVASGGSVITLTTPQNINTSANVNFATVTTTGVVQSTASGASIGFQVANGLGTPFQVDGLGNISGAGSINMTGSNPYKVSGTTIVDSSRNASFAQGTFSSAVTMNGGFTTGAFTNSVLFIGSSGNFYTRPAGGASTSISCAGVSDGWQALTTDAYLVQCLGGARYRVALAFF